MARQRVNPEFSRFLNPLLLALRSLGRSGRPAEVCEHIAKSLNLGSDELDAVLKNGQSRFENQVAWARYYLAQRGFIDSSQYGVWRLTEKGQVANLSGADTSEILITVRDENRQKRNKRKAAAAEETDEDETSAPSIRAARSDHRDELTELLRALPPEGFERFCQQLLRAAGFQEVLVTGRTGDGGIDGKGILQMNLLVSVKVLFQCKRYSGSVGAPEIRDFQGALRGRADKGLFLTTGTFTTDARKEATRDGADPIELIDLNRLIDHCEELQFGLHPQTAYVIDDSFFHDFRD